GTPRPPRRRADQGVRGGRGGERRGGTGARGGRGAGRRYRNQRPGAWGVAGPDREGAPDMTTPAARRNPMKTRSLPCLLGGLFLLSAGAAASDGGSAKIGRASGRERV